MKRDRKQAKIYQKDVKNNSHTVLWAPAFSAPPILGLNYTKLKPDHKEMIAKKNLPTDLMGNAEGLYA